MLRLLDQDGERRSFLEGRRTGIGGSDIAAIVGLDRDATGRSRRDALDVWREKLGVARDDVQSPAARRGTRLEAAVLDEYAETQGVELLRKPELRRQLGFPHRIANADALVLPDLLYGVDAKTTSGSNEVAWGPDGTDKVPDHVFLQAQWYMGVYDAPVWDIACLIGGFVFEFRCYRVQRHNGLIAKIQAKADEFWDLVVAKTPPAPTDDASAGRAARDLFSSDTRGMLSATDATTRELMRKWRHEIEPNEALALRASEDIRDRFRALIGDNAGIRVADVGQVTWRANKNGVRVLRTRWQ